ncbi:MAG TPA: hypothetical protein VL974_00975 [Magnetospirillum sp.]|jgi:hypothetical protein|nr:hypothetical protein [Magnetospirillum sp.]
MSQPQPPAPPQTATQPDHRLAWAAMIAMAAMCAGALVYAASLPAA